MPGVVNRWSLFTLLLNMILLAGYAGGARASAIPPTGTPDIAQNAPLQIASVQTAPVQTARINALQRGAVPKISSVTASYAGNGSVLVDVIGLNFVSSSLLRVGGAGLATAYISPTEVRATLTSPPIAGTQLPLVVANPNAPLSAAYNLRIPSSVPAAARLLEQTTFGATDSLIAHVQTVGLNGFLNEQLAMPATLLPRLPTAPTAQCPASSNLPLCNDENWWSNVMTGNDQLRQRVALALSEIFVISYNEVNHNALPPYVNSLAKDAFGNWSTIVKDVTLSAGMGKYLNMLNSGKPKAGAIANENFARENMQLFNLGMNRLNSDGTLQLDSQGKPIPAYTELQVQAFARVFTGWTYATSTGAVPASFPNYMPNYDSPMVPFESAHDTTAKTLLSITLPAGQTAQQDLDAALKDIFNHPNVGPFVCRQLIQHLVKSNPTPQYVRRVAAVFTDNGSGVRGDMSAVVKAIFLDQEARAGDVAPSVADGRLREPILWITNVLRALSAVPRAGVTNNSAYYVLDTMALKLGEPIFRPPSVFNFFPPDYGLPNTTLVAPEFALETTATSMQTLSWANGIVSNLIGKLSVDLSATGPLGRLASTSNNALLDELDKLFMHAQMSTQMRASILNAITPVKDPAQRVRMALYLVISSNHFKVAY